MKQDGGAPLGQRRHVSIRVSLSGSDATAADAGAGAPGDRRRAEVIALVTKLLGHDTSMPSQHQTRPVMHTAAARKTGRSLPRVRVLYSVQSQHVTQGGWQRLKMNSALEPSPTLRRVTAVQINVTCDHRT
jgi:hypothetical protein